MIRFADCKTEYSLLMFEIKVFVMAKSNGVKTISSFCHCRSLEVIGSSRQDSHQLDNSQAELLRFLKYQTFVLF